MWIGLKEDGRERSRLISAGDKYWSRSNVLLTLKAFTGAYWDHKVESLCISVQENILAPWIRIAKGKIVNELRFHTKQTSSSALYVRLTKVGKGKSANFGFKLRLGLLQKKMKYRRWFTAWVSKRVYSSLIVWFSGHPVKRFVYKLLRGSFDSGTLGQAVLWIGWKNVWRNWCQTIAWRAFL